MTFSVTLAVRLKVIESSRSHSLSMKRSLILVAELFLFRSLSTEQNCKVSLNVSSN